MSSRRLKYRFGNKNLKNPEAQMPLREHLRELKKRLIISLIAVTAAAVCAWFFYDRIFYILQQPIHHAGESLTRQVQINFESVASSLDMRVKLSFFAGIILASPVCIYELWAFMVPALRRREKRRSLLFFFMAFPFFLVGVYSGWLFLPGIIQTLTDFTPEGSSNIISAHIYFDFITRFMVVIGLAFMAPIFLVAINMVGLVTGKQLVKSWRIIVFLVFLVAAMAAPGSDAMTMLYLAAPLLAFYCLAIIVCLGYDRRKAKKKKKESRTDFFATAPEELDVL